MRTLCLYSRPFRLRCLCRDITNMLLSLRLAICRDVQLFERDVNVTSKMFFVCGVVKRVFECVVCAAMGLCDSQPLNPACVQEFAVDADSSSARWMQKECALDAYFGVRAGCKLERANREALNPKSNIPQPQTLNPESKTPKP